jgi:predicted nucleic acid-binding protein
MMSASSSTSLKLVIDAGVGVWTVLPVLSPINVLDQFLQWRQTQAMIYAPSFWLVETTSVIRRYVHAGTISSTEGTTAVNDLLNLGVEIIPIQPAHCYAAFTWAEKLGQAKAYDSFYLAIAAEINARFYSTDKRLINGAKQSGIDWVYHIGESTI